jgi:hypothetical protein
MAANFEFWEANGAGQTLSSGIGNVNWKNVDDTVTAYNASPITAGNSSFDKWQFGFFHGTYNTIQNGFFDHTSGVMGSGLTIVGFPSVTSSGIALQYHQPSTTAYAYLTKDYTPVNGSFPSSSPVVWFSGTSANQFNVKTASTSANPAYTNYLVTQLATLVGAAAGDTATATFTLRYDEN